VPHHEVMIDPLRGTGLGGHQRVAGTLREQVQQARLAHVGTADERNLRRNTWNDGEGPGGGVRNANVERRNVSHSPLCPPAPIHQPTQPCMKGESDEASV